jgi:glycosyltransferase involved in cell wall biosynthesis
LISDLDSFADNIRKILQDSRISKKLKENGKKLIEEKFLWSDIRGRMLEILLDKLKDERGIGNYSKL